MVTKLKFTKELYSLDNTYEDAKETSVFIRYFDDILQDMFPFGNLNIANMA